MLVLQVQLVSLAPVVEAGRNCGGERDRAAHADHPADQAVRLGVTGILGDRHEVLHLPDTVGGAEAGDQDVLSGR